MPDSESRGGLTAEQRAAFQGFIIATAGGTIAYQLFTGNILSLFAHGMEFSPFLIGTLYLAIQVPALMQIWGARYVDRHGGKRLILACWLWSPLTVLSLILAPQVGAWLGAWAAIAAVFLGAAAFSLFNSVAGAPWWALVGHNLPKPRIAELLGKMNRIAMFLGLGATLGFSLFLGERPAIWRFQAMFVIGAAVSAVRAIRFERVKDSVPSPRESREPLRSELRSAWSDLSFRRLIIFTAIIFLAGGIVVPFRPLYVVSLGFSERFAAMLTLPLILGSYGLTAQAWGKLADRFGSRGVYVLAGSGVALGQLILTLPRGNGALDGAFLVGGLFLGAACWGGFDSGNMRRLYTIVPGRNPSLYLVIHNVVVSVSLSLGSFLGGVIVKVMRAVIPPPDGAYGFSRALDYRVLFLCAAVLIVTGIGYSRRMLAMEEIPTSRLVIYLRLRTQRWLMNGLPDAVLRLIRTEEE